MEMELFLIRHGKTKGNEEKRYIGRTQESLSELGRSELASQRYPEISLLFSSPMLRCKETCEILFPGIPVRVIEEFREIDFGSFEGKNYRELSGDPEYQAWIDSGGRLPFPGGESREAFAERCVRGFRHMMELIRLNPDTTTPAAAVVHGGTIMAVLSGLFGGDYFDYQIPNGEGYRIRVEVSAKDLRITSAERWQF